jgi:glycosyltransferase involved in cell wall biosynthesis
MTTKQPKPKVSVLLPVYNGEPYLKAAIESILNQTFRDFELIIIDDGSKDRSKEIISQFKDKRIRWQSQPNAGLASTLNKAMKLAHGDYLARQDQDDLSLPERLAKQVDFLDKHPNIGVVGTASKVWIEDKPTEQTLKHPSQNPEIQFNLLFDTPFVHSSVTIRRSTLDKVGLYTTDPKRQPPEDYELWSRLGRSCQLANLPDTLHIYRETKGSMSRVGPCPFVDKVVTISQENIASTLKRPFSDPVVATLAECYHRKPMHARSVSFWEVKKLVIELRQWAEDLPGANSESLRKAAETVLSRVDGYWPRSLPERVIRAAIYRLQPDLITKRKAVRL